jgi:hypothetical protein
MFLRHIHTILTHIFGYFVFFKYVFGTRMDSKMMRIFGIFVIF